MIRQPIAMALSGGGARSAAHIGAIQALTERDLRPDRFVGTSMGGVVAACFAAGLQYQEVLQRISAISRKDVASFSPGVVLGPLARSLLQEGPFRETLETLVPARTFAELAVPLTVTAVDARSGDLVLFGAGGRSHVPLIDALYATCALPVYYPPAVIGDREFTDGGVRAVFPLDVAGDFRPGTVIGVNVGPSRYDQAHPVGIGARGIVAAHRRAMRIMMAIQIEQTIARWRKHPPVDCIIVEPPVTRAGTFAVDRVVEYVEQGYRAMIRKLAKRDPG